jgi:hypothetical protein
MMGALSIKTIPTCGGMPFFINLLITGTTAHSQIGKIIPNSAAGITAK